VTASAVTALVLCLSGCGTPKSSSAPGSNRGRGLPHVLVCSPGSPAYEPTSIRWCTSYCSSYVDHIAWTSWTEQSASGLGTLMTDNGIPSCASGTWTSNRGYHVTLSDPKAVSYCTESDAKASAILFTSTDVYRYPIPEVLAQC